ncbi:MAG: helix-turn-helix domain-containing protein [bacterium]|nr:helix-turn-helix domain-containing protein [bacterium]
MFAASARHTTAETPEIQRSPAMTIIHRIATESGITVSDMLSPSKRRKFLVPRNRAIVEVAETCRLSGERLSLGTLGRLFKRDHTTVLHALQKAGLR